MMYIMKQEQFTTTADGKKRRREEIKSLKMCSHQNIVKYLDDFFENGVQKIVMEYCTGKQIKNQIELQFSFIIEEIILFSRDKF